MNACDLSRFLGDDGHLTEDERQLLGRARALIPLLAERAPAATAARNVPPETIAEYHAAGILKLLQPKRFGGLQGRFSLFSQIVEELTYGCASSAWVYAVLAEHQWIIAGYPEAAQIDVWGENPDAVAASSLAPRAAAKPVAGGWRLSGRYTFSSGCDYAQWAILGAFLGELGDPRHVAYLLVPLAEVEIVDDWQVLGLAGTGSKSLVLDECSSRSTAASWSATYSPGRRRAPACIRIIRSCGRRAAFSCRIRCRRSRSRSAAAPSTSCAAIWRPACRAA
jgi:alkylation response protein AidB-like acyl-CoA dehydrogenase